MPITTLDPKTALVVIDLQNGIVAMPAAHPVEPVIANASRLADAFRARALPVVLVRVVPSRAPRRTDEARQIPELPPAWSEIVPQMNAQPADHIVTKQSWNAFAGTGLEVWLKSQGVTGIVLCGVATSIGVEGTARQAFEAGFNIAFATDAMTDRSVEAHEHSLTRIFPRLGETGTTAVLLQQLESA